MMTSLLRIPHGFLRRHLSSVERALVAAGLSILLLRLLTIFPVYPSPWEVVLAVTIFLVMLWSPTVGYFLIVAAVLYPLYTISLYLAVLFLAVSLLGQRVFIHNLGALLLVLITPWLAQYQMAWLAPLIGGLWWGKSGGAWIGALAALWSQLLFGMVGSSPDLLAVLGTSPSVAVLVERFSQAGSLETLILLVSPFAPNPTLLLYYLLQVILWGMTAALTGGLAERRWVQERRALRVTVVVFAGALILFAGHLGLAAWLEQYAGNRLFEMAPQLVLQMLAVAVVAAVLDGVLDFAEHPLPVGRPDTEHKKTVLDIRSRWAERLAYLLGKKRRAHEQAGPAALEAGIFTPMQVPPDLPQRPKKNQKPDDIIKIEFD